VAETSTTERVRCWSRWGVSAAVRIASKNALTTANFVSASYQNIVSMDSSGAKHSSAVGRWTVAISYYVICCLLHLEFSLWLVRRRDTVFGPLAFTDWMPTLSVAVGLGLVFVIAKGLRNQAHARVTCIYWLIWLAAVVLIDRFLTFSINEYFHYPQYATLALLVAWALDPKRNRWLVARVLFWTTLMGMGDELLQYLWITTSYSEYLDFNDFIVNLVSAAAGVLLFYGPVKSQSVDMGKKFGTELWVAVGIALIVVGGLLGGRIVVNPQEAIPPGGILRDDAGLPKLFLQRQSHIYGSWQNGPRRGTYYVMPPVPGVLAMAMLGLIFVSYARVRLRGTLPNSGHF